MSIRTLTARSALAAVLLALCACSAAPPGAPRPAPLGSGERAIRASGSADLSMSQNRSEMVYADTIAAGAPTVWAALPSVYEALGIPLDHSDPRAMQLGVRSRRIGRVDGQRPARFLDCGRGPMANYADSYQVYLWTDTRIILGSGGARVETVVRANAQARDTSGDPVPCASLGTLERRIVELLRERVASAAPGA